VTSRVVPIPVLAALALGLSVAGCIPKIGDDCNTSIDCSQVGDRLCDTTQPQGYCTVFNCEPGTCPDAAVCVAFNHSIDPACSGKNDGAWPRFERTFCVAGCNADNECRDGYACVAPAAHGAIVVDTKAPREKVCLVGTRACSDGQKNGDETDVDCGGGCSACAAGDACKIDGDCESGMCNQKVCETSVPGVCTPGATGTLPKPYEPPDAGGGGSGGGSSGSSSSGTGT
jgi:hypothetical protein